MTNDFDDYVPERSSIAFTDLVSANKRILELTDALNSTIDEFNLYKIEMTQESSKAVTALEDLKRHYIEKYNRKSGSSTFLSFVDDSVPSDTAHDRSVNSLAPRSHSKIGSPTDSIKETALGDALIAIAGTCKRLDADQVYSSVLEATNETFSAKLTTSTISQRDIDEVTAKLAADSQRARILASELSDSILANSKAEFSFQLEAMRQSIIEIELRSSAAIALAEEKARIQRSIDKEVAELVGQVAKEASDLILANAYADATANAAKISVRTAAAMVTAEGNSRLQQKELKSEAKLAMDAADLAFARQKVEFNEAVIAANLKFESEVVSAKISSDSILAKVRADAIFDADKIKDQTVDAMAIVEAGNRKAVKVAKDNSDLILARQKIESKEAATVANDKFVSEVRAAKNASDSILASAKADAVFDAAKIKDQTVAAMAIVQAENSKAVTAAKDTADLLLATQRQEYNEAAVVANDKFESEVRAAKETSDSILASAKADATFDAAKIKDQTVAAMAIVQAENSKAVTVAKDTADLILANQEESFTRAAVIANKNFNTKLANMSLKLAKADSKRVLELADQLLQDNLLLIEKMAQDMKSAKMEAEIRRTHYERDQLQSICSNVAHDFKTPMQTFVLSIDCLSSAVSALDFGNLPTEKGASLRSNLLEPIKIMLTAYTQMQSIINRSIEYSKAVGDIPLHPSLVSFELLTSLNSVIATTQPLLPADGSIALNIHALPTGVNSVISDKFWFDECLFCLLSNSVKYSAVSKIDVNLNVDFSTAMMEVSVSDDGAGVQEELLSTLFEATASTQRKSVGGSGMGLFILQKRCEGIGGSCGVDTECRTGSRLWFRFPYQPGEAIESRDEEFEQKFEALNILVVDDTALVLKMLTRMLSDAGHNVATAINGLDGFHAAVSNHPTLDVVLMDMQMPVMDGITALKRLREHENKNDMLELSVIGFSASSSSDVVQEFHGAGANCFLPKPVTKASFEDAIVKLPMQSGKHSRMNTPANSLKYQKVSTIDK